MANSVLGCRQRAGGALGAVSIVLALRGGVGSLSGGDALKSLLFVTAGLLGQTGGGIVLGNLEVNLGQSRFSAYGGGIPGDR